MIGLADLRMAARNDSSVVWSLIVHSPSRRRIAAASWPEPTRNNTVGSRCIRQNPDNAVHEDRRRNRCIANSPMIALPPEGRLEHLRRFAALRHSQYIHCDAIDLQVHGAYGN